MFIQFLSSSFTGFTQWPELAAIAGILFFAMLTYVLFVICYRKNDGLFW
jgi:uncharacterized membrane protein YhdT